MVSEHLHVVYLGEFVIQLQQLALTWLGWVQMLTLELRQDVFFDRWGLCCCFWLLFEFLCVCDICIIFIPFLEDLLLFFQWLCLSLVPLFLGQLIEVDAYVIYGPFFSLVSRRQRFTFDIVEQQLLKFFVELRMATDGHLQLLVQNLLDKLFFL